VEKNDETQPQLEIRERVEENLYRNISLEENKGSRKEMSCFIQALILNARTLLKIK